ncbi:hypothetical protein [Microbacterium hominis]|uniref:Uncharacterized protein n=1 Tax=Microbacterium hominis TaxID=162426 RepID=A0A7D4PNK8_9MICO|nr:hypothetical protein [Microbacterium hominis]QKJ20355.1 hypothetical protein HQM25_13955 [Microbacterium hominis]
MFERDFAAAVFDLLVERIGWRRRAPVRGLLNPATVRTAQEGDIFWGLGLDGLSEPIAMLDVRAVRGPLTANALLLQGLEVPKVFGDAAMLLPRYVPELSDASGHGRTGGAMLLGPSSSVDATFSEHVRVVSGVGPLSETLHAIVQSSMVVSASVTAVAIAESLNVPARLFADPVVANRFEQRDYLAGTGRPFAKISGSAARALGDEAYPPPTIDLDLLDSTFPQPSAEISTEGEPRESIAVSAEAYTVPAHLLMGWQETIHRQEGSPDPASFARDLSLRLDSARASSDLGLAQEVARAAEYVSIVNPELVAEAAGDDARLLSAVAARKLGLVASALATRGDEARASLTFSRGLADEVLLGIGLSGPSIDAGWPRTLVLRLESESNSLRVDVDYRLFDQQRVQWRLDLDFLIPLSALSEQDRWRLSVVVGDVVIPVTIGALRPLSDPGSRPERGSQVILSVGAITKGFEVR